MNEDRPHILGLVWDRLLLAFLRKALPADRFRVTVAETLDAAVDALFTHRPDLVVVAAAPDAAAGTASCRELQAVDEVPVIVLVPSADSAGAVRALTCADDYVALPVAPMELEARVRAVLRRAGTRSRQGQPIYDDGILHVDLQNRTANLGGDPLALTPTEFRLLALLVASPGRLFPHGDLLRRVWGAAYSEDAHLLRLHIANLRRKIEKPGGHSYIRTHRQIGYAFEPAPPAEHAAESRG